MALIASAAIHVIALALLLTWREAPQLLPSRQALTTIAFPKPPPPPPPPPQPHKAEHRRAAAEAAGDPGKRAKASPQIAKAIPVRLPPVAAPPKPSTGDRPRSGAALAGNGPGAGGTGNGPGGGGTGGEDDGGSEAEWTGGKIKDSDYPKAARAAGTHGTTATEITVSADGRPTGCKIAHSSGSAELDQTTCRLIMQRFRFRPARDRTGRKIADSVDYDQDWTYERGGDE